MFKYLDVVTVLFRDEVHRTESNNISLLEKRVKHFKEYIFPQK